MRGFLKMQKPNLGIIMPNMGISKTKSAKPRATTKPMSVADTLFTATQQRVLGQLFGQPDRSFYAAEMIAAGGGSGAVQRELARLEASGLVETDQLGRQKHYQANPGSPIFEELRAIVLKTSVLPTLPDEKPTLAAVFKRLGVTRHQLAAFCRKHHIAKFSLFGSVTRADFRADSDVDVWVQFEPRHVPGLGIVDIRDELSQLFGRPVDLLTGTEIRNPFRRKSIERDLLVAYVR